MAQASYIVAWQSRVSLAHGKHDRIMSHEEALKECEAYNRMYGEKAHYYPQRYDGFKRKFMRQDDSEPAS